MAALARPIDLSKGTVTSFDVRRGFGFITPADGGENLFVHQSSIKAVGYRSLAVGEAVEFVIFVGDDGRRRAVSVTSPGGAFIEGRRYFGGACYRCGEIGHMAMHYKSNVAGNRLGSCYKCGVMGHLARDCSATLIEPSSPKSDILKPSKLGSIKPLSRKEEIRNLSDRLSKNMDSEEEEEEYDDDDDDDEINNYDSEFPRGVEQRNWADLPRDVLSVIFNKITAVDIIRSAQFVCRSWKQLSQEPELWRHIVLKAPADDLMDKFALEFLAILAIDRSEGCVEEFHLECYPIPDNNELIYQLSDRATKLRRLRLISIYDMSEKAFAHAIKKFPLLEEFEISFCYFLSDLVELVGIACPQLKSFRLNAQFNYPYDYDGDSDGNSDAEAFSIAKHMQQLQRLQLVGNHLTNIGLLAILDNCPNLQCIDIRQCLNVDFDENMKKKCAKMKELRLPMDSTADFELNSFIDDLVALDAEYYDSDYDFGYFDPGGFSDMSYDDFFEIY